MKRMLSIVIAFVILAVVLAGCGSRADTASHNLSVAADNFQVPRTISFYNGVTGQNMLIIKGLCSIGNGNSQDAPSNGGTLTVTCKADDGKVIKDFLGLSDNVTYMVQQQIGVKVSDAHYEFIWRPSTLIPGISIQ